MQKLTNKTSAAKLFIALDCKTEIEAQSIIEKLSPINNRFKVGLELFLATGKDFVRKLVENKTEVFLDLKFHDIPNTVYGAVRQVASLGIAYLSLHIAGGEAMLKAAKKAIEESSSTTRLLGITVLTSLNKADLATLGISRNIETQVLEIAKLAKSWGLHGIVCSPLELNRVKKLREKNFITIVPGIYEAKEESNREQKRSLSAKEASKLGSDYIVVGRSILKAKDPIQATKNILEQLC